MLYEEAMKSGNSTSEVTLLTRIKYLLSMLPCIIAIRTRFQTSDMEKLSAYHGTFADFAKSLSTKFPQIAITEYYDMMEGLGGVQVVDRYCGLLLRMSDIGNSLPILLPRKDIQKINRIESYSELIEKLQSGKIGKVVGRDVYIRPYEYAMILVNPLKDIESIINTI